MTPEVVVLTAVILGGNCSPQQALEARMAAESRGQEALINAALGGLAWAVQALADTLGIEAEEVLAAMMTTALEREMAKDGRD